MEKMYIIDEIGEDFVVVNGERIEVDPLFKTLPDKQEYETWLNEVMTDAVEAILVEASKMDEERRPSIPAVV